MRPSKMDLENWYQGHATAEGNRVLANILADYLRDNYPYLKTFPEKKGRGIKLVEANAGKERN
jgi:hypothetical protein